MQEKTVTATASRWIPAKINPAYSRKPASRELTHIYSRPTLHSSTFFFVTRRRTNAWGNGLMPLGLSHSPRCTHCAASSTGTPPSMLQVTTETASTTRKPYKAILSMEEL